MAFIYVFLNRVQFLLNTPIPKGSNTLTQTRGSISNLFLHHILYTLDNPRTKYFAIDLHLKESHYHFF